MFKSFWDRKKYIVELVGIIVAIGALFLAIPIPEQERAREALMDIQFFFLLLITIGLLVFFDTFLLPLAKELKIKVKTEDKFIINGLTLAVLSLFFWLIFNLWDYILALYESSLINFIKSNHLALVVILGTVFFFYIENNGNKISKLTQVFAYSIISSALFSGIAITIGRYLLNVEVNLINWTIVFIPLFIFFLTFLIIALISSSVKKKLQTPKP